MAAQYETGYSTNIGNFKKLRGYCEALGASYNPALVLIQVASLQAQSTAVRIIQSEYTDLYNDYQLTVNANQINFKPSRNRATRVLAATKSCGTTTENIQNVKSLCDTLRGIRHTAMPAPGTPEADNIISTSHQSMQNIVRTWGQLIDLLSKIPEYLPTTPDITVAELTLWRSTIIASLNLTIQKYAELTIKRSVRNQAFDLPQTGLCDVAQQAKEYIKSVFGASSNEYHHVAKIQFRRHPL